MDLFEKLACERGITVEEMRAAISNRIENGWNDPDITIRAQWRKIPCVGEISTPEEWMEYAVGKLEEERGGDLLVWHPDL